MPVSLTLLDGVRWNGTAVVGDRSKALLAALAAAPGRTVRSERLVDLIWGEEPLANATKGLQVVVSRTRTACGADAIVRDGEGYRLGLPPAAVDSSRLAGAVAAARAALDGDPVAAAELAREALALGAALASVGPHEPGPLAELRRGAAGDLAAARQLLAQASSRTGAHADALPALEEALAAVGDDESLLADLLRSEAVVRGPGAALDRFERHRRDLLDRLGTNPGEALQRVHRDLLALDRPVRRGVRHDATALLGRDGDVERLRALLSSARVVSIVGPGGLGKTRLAHVLARDASQPVVHVVELVGVTAPEDLVSEVGSVLGVRDSVSSRRTLTPEQRADVRARIAQRLGQGPGLLVLDNCEHLIAAVAELVAFLVSAAPDLRVLTTTRAPLAIAAERVYPLDVLLPADAVELFRQRAVAARPGVQLDDVVVENVVVRLDGLPLAIELAAAKVRVMGVEEIDRRLSDRFALLRGGDRSAPDRHQTLLAVIDWSWNLLGEQERRALRRLALFHDGFTLEAADAVLGDGALDAVQNLVDQSLLSVSESPAGVRCRMLETVREFGRLRLAQAGEEAEARAALRRWATAYGRRHGERLFSTGQFDAIDAIAAEESNLADELRDALAGRDVETVVRLVASLGAFWAIRGDHGRVMVLTEPIADVVRDWSPPPRLEDATRAAMSITLSNAMISVETHTGPLRELLRRLGPGESDRRLAATTRVMLDYDPADAPAFLHRLEAHSEDPDRYVALTALQWLSHARENGGDPTGAVEAATHAVTRAREEDGPWSTAILRTQLAALTMQLGDRDAGKVHAQAALPVLVRLGAKDDEIQLRSLLVLCALAEQQFDEAKAEIERIDRIEDPETTFSGMSVVQVGGAELQLARGDRAGGLLAYRRAAERMRGLRFPGVDPTGLEPWALFGTATALTAHAQYASAPAEEAAGRALFEACRSGTVRILNPADPHLDYPVAGMLLFALGSWGLLRDATRVDDAARLLALAERFAYNRTIPTMAWERIAPSVEERAPGRLAEVRAELGDRRAPELLDAARGLVEQLGG
ncbi:AfsR/SARP family transcriptional regulator [Conexibacter woesei]|uniref:AfsR/SARP family transcriptional regulator n=1 Tax=Conexibacter woesei TaxID=191495 RepID=UPI000323FF19|nr:BTAD domain-containing putative transcriptional regulator [Conexibacter woesei]